MGYRIRKKICKTAYRIFLYIGANQSGEINTQTDLARALSLPITCVNYWITKFKQEGLINKYIELTQKGYNLFIVFWKDKTFSMQYRGHNLQIIYNVVKCPWNFPHCFSKVICKPLENGRYKGIKTRIRETTVLFYSPTKIVCVIPDIFANNPEDIASALALECAQLKAVLEETFQGIKIEGNEIAKIISMHVARPSSILAESFILKGRNYKSKKIEIDSSKGLPEIETVDARSALYDIELIKEMEEIKENIKMISPIKKKEKRIKVKKK